MNMCAIPHTPSPIDLKHRNNVGLLNPTQVLGRKRDAYPSPTRGSTNWGMLIPASKGAHWVWSTRQCGIAQCSPRRKRDAYSSPPPPPLQGGSTIGRMLIPALQAQPHQGAAQMGGCLSLTSKGGHWVWSDSMQAPARGSVWQAWHLPNPLAIWTREVTWCKKYVQLCAVDGHLPNKGPRSLCHLSCSIASLHCIIQLWRTE